MAFYVWAAAALVSAIVWIIRKVFFEPTSGLQFPVVGRPDDNDLRYAVLEGAKKYPDTPFVVPLKPPRVILPMSLYKEVMNLPHEDLSFGTELYHQFQGRVSHLGENYPEVVPIVRHEVTKDLHNILSLFQDEAGYAFKKELGSSTDWTDFALYPKILRLVAHLSGRVFVGTPLNRDEEWIDASINYTTHSGQLGRAADKWNPLLRPIVIPFLPETRQVRQDLKQARAWMEPLVNDILSRDREKAGSVQTGTRGTYMSWLLKYLSESGKTVEHVAIHQMLIAFASTHTVSYTAYQALLDMATRREYLEPLREEIDKVLNTESQELDDNGTPYYKKEAYAKLVKLDSFIKESMRLHPLGYTGSLRRTKRDVTLSNGIKLPKGTPIAFPSWAIVNSPETLLYSPEYNAGTGNLPADTFDGFRFSRLRELAGRETKHQAATTSPYQFNFGHGPDACPGRFFAVYELKVILVEFLRNFDFRLADDLEGTGGEEKRPKEVIVKLGNVPDTTVKMAIRRRFGMA